MSDSDTEVCENQYFIRSAQLQYQGRDIKLKKNFMFSEQIWKQFL